MFEYCMVQVPPNIIVTTGKGGGAAADYLSEIVNQYAEQGWEFYSLETIGIIEKPGCGCLGAVIAFLLRIRPTHTPTYVVVFRKPRGTA